MRGTPASDSVGHPRIIRARFLATEQPDEQVEQIFQNRRSQLMSLHMALRQEETRLRALVDSEHPDDAQVFAQIDRVVRVLNWRRLMAACSLAFAARLPRSSGASFRNWAMDKPCEWGWAKAWEWAEDRGEAHPISLLASRQVLLEHRLQNL